MIKLGSSAFISEASIACMMFLGNYVFIRHLGEDGVAAFSIACYFFPIIFMVYNAIAQSAQPIISYNFGAGQPERVRKTLHLAIRTALICGISFFILTALCCQDIVSLFIDRSYAAFDIAVNGLPYFEVGFIFFAVNMIGIGYYQSVERGQRATIITLLRGVVFMLIGFFALPPVLGIPGIWLAVPLAELLTTFYIFGIYLKDRFIVCCKADGMDWANVVSNVLCCRIGVLENRRQGGRTQTVYIAVRIQAVRRPTVSQDDNVPVFSCDGADRSFTESCSCRGQTGV